MSISIAFAGHTAAQVPHPMHFVLSIWHLPFPSSDIAIAGHTPMQVWQPIHFVLSIL
jgi:hypothetical protein